MIPGLSLRSTLTGAAVGAIAFGGVSVYRSLAMGATPFEHIQPILALALLGGTVGGLIGPMMGQIVRRFRSNG